VVYLPQKSSYSNFVCILVSVSTRSTTVFMQERLCEVRSSGEAYNDTLHNSRPAAIMHSSLHCKWVGNSSQFLPPHRCSTFFQVPGGDVLPPRYVQLRPVISSCFFVLSLTVSHAPDVTRSDYSWIVYYSKTRHSYVAPHLASSLHCATISVGSPKYVRYTC